MSTITMIRLWNDPGFTEGCIEVPKPDNKLPPATQTFVEGFNTNTDVMFSKITIPGPYSVLMNSSYIEVTVDWNHTSPQTYYGWVDKVELKSDTTGYNSVNIYWHVDLWRTYIAFAQFGYGMVMRRPLKENDMIPPQPYPHRFDVPAKRIPIASGDTWWVFINVNFTGGETGKINYNQTYAVPVNVANPTTAYTISGAGATVPLQNFINGSWDEDLGLVPENVKAVFLSPIAPTTATISGNTVSMGWGYMTPEGGKASVFTVPGLYSSITEYVKTLPTAIMTDDTKRYIITGFDGEVVGELPWGIPVGELRYRVVIDSTSGYIQIRSGINGHAQGTCWTVPLIAVELSQNSWSSYAYSGARQADIQQRALDIKVQRDSAFLNTGLSAGGNVMQGLIGAGVAGLGGPIGIGLGVASTAMSAVSAQANYKYQQGVNDRQQAIADYRAASQPNGLIMSGSGFDCLRFGNKGIFITEMDHDEYSTAIRDKDIELFGAHVCEPTEDCSELMRAGGGLMITNLIVKGDIPVEAKAYIKARLQGGVRII